MTIFILKMTYVIFFTFSLFALLFKETYRFAIQPNWTLRKKEENIFGFILRSAFALEIPAPAKWNLFVSQILAFFSQPVSVTGRGRGQ